MRDPHLTSDGYTQYDATTLVEGKRQCKLALQRELGLPEDPDAPLFGFIGRLDYQKGVDLIRDSAGWLMGQGAQVCARVAVDLEGVFLRGRGRGGHRGVGHRRLVPSKHQARKHQATTQHPPSLP